MGLGGADVEFRLLGPVEVCVGGRLVQVGAARRRCVLAALLWDANRGVSLDRLVERVWGGDRLPEQPRRAAQAYVSLLRSAMAGIDDVAIARRPDGYLIALDERRVDVHEFYRLVAQARSAAHDDQAVALRERALALWRGEAFGTLDTPWVATVRATLNQERLAVQRELTDLQLGQGRHGTLLAQLHSWAQDHPLDEHLAGQLMLALFRSGRRADALEHYHRTRDRLSTELGTDPGRALRDLYHRMLTDDPSLDRSAHPVRRGRFGDVSAPAPAPAPGRDAVVYRAQRRTGYH